MAATTSWRSASPTIASPAVSSPAATSRSSTATGTQDLLRRGRHHRRLRQWLRQRAARGDRRQDLFRGRKRRARRRCAHHLQQRRLYGVRALRGEAEPRADLAHQGAQDHLERAGQDGAVRELPLRAVRPPDRLRAGLRDRRPDGEAQDGLPFPGIAYKSELGVGFNVPFYIALSPTYDATLYGRYYTKQGFLGMAEWRQRFNNGQYNLRIAGINQEDPGGFRLRHHRRRNAGRPQQAARHGRIQGRLRDQSTLVVRLGRARPVRQEFLLHLWHSWLFRLCSAVGASI